MGPEVKSDIGVLTPEKALELDRIQETAANDALNYLEVRTPEDGFPLIAMATGIGKGRIIHKIIERTVRKNPNSRVLVIAGTKLVLVDQTHDALSGYLQEQSGDDEVYIEAEDSDELSEDTEDTSEEVLEQSFLYSTVDYKKRTNSQTNVHVATIQTVQAESSRDNLNPDDYDLVIVDEAHNIGTRSRSDTINQFKNVVGFTATPFRHSGVLKEPEQYGFNIISSLTLPEAQERGFLPPLVENAIPTDHLVDEIPTNLNGEIDYKKLEKLLKESDGLRPFIADSIQGFLFDGERKKKTVVAVNFVWEAEELARLLKVNGISVGVAVNNRAAREIHSEEIPALDAIDRYKLPRDDPNGLQVLISPYVASEGFDAPETEVLVWASPTDSSVRYTQFTGRLARRAPGKQYGHVVDFLYQTSQYKWSYNFGQWMKDTVVQLPDGRLFQGSKRQLADVARSNRSFNTPSEEQRLSLEEMLDGKLDKVRETDFPLTVMTFRGTFVGGEKNRELIDEAISEIEAENPSLIARRIQRSSIVSVVTDKELFIRKMQEKGIALKDQNITQFQSDEFPITNTEISSIFVGGYGAVRPFVAEVIEELRQTDPSLIKQRKSGSSTITVVTDRDLFISRMQDHGARIKGDFPEVQESEAPISTTFLTSMFIGRIQSLQEVSQTVLEEIRQKNPELIVQKRAGTAYITVVTDRTLFMEKMKEHGVKERDLTIEEVSDTEFLITDRMLREYFRGTGDKTMKAANEAVEAIAAEHPDLVKRRQIRGNFITVIADRDLFFQKMVEMGIERREDDIINVLPSDFPLTRNMLVHQFVGRPDKIREVSDRVIGELIKENPDIVQKRRTKTSYTYVVTQSDIYLKKMVENGVQLRESEADNEASLTVPFLQTTFIGHISAKLLPMANQVIQEMVVENPELIQERLSGSRTSKVIKDKELFIRKMLEKGAKLKDPTSPYSQLD